MTTPRFFVSPAAFRQNRVELDSAVVHQIRNVLRLRSGDQVILLDDTGWAYNVTLDVVERDRVSGTVMRKALATGEPRTKITLYQGVLKGQHVEWVLQKGTEIGVVEFVPVICARCLMSSLDDISSAKIARWERIILEAAEQSRRGRLPRLRPPVVFSQACEQTRRSGLALMPWEEERAVGLREALLSQYSAESAAPSAGEGNPRRPFSVALLIGPEGGFADEEIELARRYDIRTVTLGTRVLRAETAALVATTIVLHTFGDLG